MKKTKHGAGSKTAFSDKTRRLKTRVSRHSKRLLPRSTPKSRWATLLGPSIIALTAVSSLVTAGWGLGLATANSDGRYLAIKLEALCLTEGHAEVLIATEVKSKNNSAIHRLLNGFPLSRYGLFRHSDRIRIRIEVYGQNKSRITEEFLKSCAAPFVIHTSVPVRYSRLDYSDYSGPSKRRRQSWYKSVIEINELLEAAATDSYVELETINPLMEEIGVSRATFSQLATVIPGLPAAASFRIVNRISIPDRFDDIQTTGSTATPSITLSFGRAHITEEGSFNDSAAPPAQRSEKALPSWSIVTSIACTDSQVKRVEDFLVFAAAAVFGVAVGAFFEMILARAKQ